MNEMTTEKRKGGNGYGNDFKDVFSNHTHAQRNIRGDFRKRKLSEMFRQWNEGQQEEFLDVCTGNRGLRILYDSFFKEILNPETAPERLEDFLSLVLKKSKDFKSTS